MRSIMTRTDAGLIYLSRGIFAFAIGLALIWAPLANANTPTVKIAVAVSVTGVGEPFGRPAVDGVKLAVEEANSSGATPLIEISVHDDESDTDRGREIMHGIADGDALVVIGPATTPMALAVGPVCTERGLVCIGTTTTGDTVTNNENLFRASFSTSDAGEALANYLRYILDGTSAIVLVNEDSYGGLVAAGFRRAAERLQIDATYQAFRTDQEAKEAARLAAEAPGDPAIILAMLDAVPVLTTLRRHGVRGPILGTNTIAAEDFNARFASDPEELKSPGYFTEGVYAASPLMFDSANSETLAFANRFRARFNREPSYVEAQGYEAGLLAIAAVHATVGGGNAAHSVQARRAAIRAFLVALDGPERAVAGLTGPLYFTPERGRKQALRIGRFQNGRFESAPAQLSPVPYADPAEIDSGAVVDIGSGNYARRQQVVYTGIFLNAIARLDVAQSRFTADFYVWLRFADDTSADAANPAHIDFPDMIRGTSDGKQLGAQRVLEDGTIYRLWRVRGDFKNDFDLRHFPADRQTLTIQFINARAASDRVVYVRDRQLPVASELEETSRGDGASPGSFAPATAGEAQDTFGSAVAPDAFRDISQWQPIRIRQLRDSMVTKSALGDPGLVGFNRVRELSGFKLTVELRRRVITTLVKTLLPLGLMTLILYASLHFPAALVKEKVAVAITAALSGAVLLSSINSQLGSIGYVIAVEYGFYVFFTLCLLCIVLVLISERLRVVEREPMAVAVEHAGRYIYLLGLFSTVAVAIYVASRT